MAERPEESARADMTAETAAGADGTGPSGGSRTRRRAGTDATARATAGPARGPGPAPGPCPETESGTTTTTTPGTGTGTGTEATAGAGTAHPARPAPGDGPAPGDRPALPHHPHRPEHPAHPPLGPSRRALLGAATAATAATGATAATALAAAVTPPAPPAFASASAPAVVPGPVTVQASAVLPAAAFPADPTVPARDALRRLLPRHAGQFRLRITGGPERFRVSGAAGRITVEGTSPAVLLTGVHWYLKYVCRAHISWSGSRTDALPAVLPAPPRPLEREATVPHRFALNDTHDGYTAPYADWPHWERLIDVLALNGFNEVLVTPGHEAVHRRLLLECGYSDAEARAWLPAPSHQAWWLLANLSGYGGPLSPSLIGRRAELGRRITGRLRELGMEPVLPGWSGMVPDGFADRNAGARVVPQGLWNGLRRPDWLDPRSPAFARTAAAYYRHQRELLGPARFFKTDLLHEGGTLGGVPLGDAARAVERSMRAGRPDAVWVVLGWQSNPRPELLDAVDRSRMLIVDGLSDLDATGDRDREWRGTPYCFGTIPNFGGRTTLGAGTDRWTGRFPEWRDRPGSALAGTAYLPEAAERDPAALELFGELAWRRERIDRDAWFARYADFRYGERDRAARSAFTVLARTAYKLTSTDGRPAESLFGRRPGLGTSIGTSYDPADFDRAFAALLGVRPRLRESDTYRHDLTELARQALANRSRTLQFALRAAHAGRDTAAFRGVSVVWLRLLRLADAVSGCHRAFLLGPWLEEAKRFAADPAEAAELERTARALITTWADRGAAGAIGHYAHRDWHGLLSEVHLPQWERWLVETAAALEEGRAAGPFDWYPAEEEWTRNRRPHPVRPVGDAYRTARRVFGELAAAPYQGLATVSAEPAAFRPGEAGAVTAVFRNLNGLRGTGRVELLLNAPDLGPEPACPAVLAPVPAGGAGRASWRVTAPAVRPAEPLHPLPYRLTVTHGPAGSAPVAVTFPGRLYVASPLGPDWRTFSSNGAVFGELDGRWAIEGGGDDLWRGSARFGTVYRPGVLRPGGSVAVRVDGLDDTGSGARAGLVVRTRLDVPGAPGFAHLAVTPRRGVALSYDANGDGSLDTRRTVDGVRAPVLLRLSLGADGARLTGEVSDGRGGGRRVVGTAVLPGVAGPLDAGFFMTAGNGGSGARGRARFGAWSAG
jgi:hypothetical protein